MQISDIYQAAKYFFPPPPIPHGEATDCIPASAGVYFIYEDQSIVYVGESINLRKRLRRHLHLTPSRKVTVIQCDVSQRKRLESFYIGVVNPPLNRESTFRCKAGNVKRKMSASLYRRVHSFVSANPGCSLSELRHALGGSRTSRVVRNAVERLEEWKLIHEVLTPTAGRTKRIYFCHADVIHLTSVAR